MKINITFFIAILLTAISLILSEESAYAQTDSEIVSYFVKEQLEVKENQTVFNVFKIENKSERIAKLQVNFTLPVDWEFFGDRTYFLTLAAGQKVSLPLRISPSTKAKGGVGYALNASLLTMNGDMFASKYCFLTVPVKNSIDINFSSIAYYLDHRYGKTSTTLKIRNTGNSNQLMGLKISCDDHLQFIETGEVEYNTELSLMPGRDTTIRTVVKYNDMIENISYYNKSMTAEISTRDTIIDKYTIIKYLNHIYDHYIEDSDQPLVLELSMLDLLADAISYRAMAYGKLKFPNQKSLAYYYRTLSGQIKDIPNWKYDEYSLKYSTKKNSIEAGNLRDDEGFCMFGHAIKYRQEINSRSSFKISALDDVYSSNLNLSGILNASVGNLDIRTQYTKIIDDTTYSPITDLYGLGAKINMNKLGILDVEGKFNKYIQDEYSNKDGRNIDINYNLSLGKLYSNFSYSYAAPYAITYNRGRKEVHGNIHYMVNKRSYIQGNYTQFKYQPANIYNNISQDLNYTYHNTRLVYNYALTLNSSVYLGPNYDYGTSNYYNFQKIDVLKLSSVKGEIGYRYAPNQYLLQSVNINIQAGQMTPLAYSDSISSSYKSAANVLKFSATAQGKRWGVYAMYYSGLYNMSMALTNFYTGTAGKYLYFLPYFKIVSANKKFYYEIRFSYLNNLDLKNTRTSIMQEAGADLGNGWSMRLQNNTNIQSLQDATGQSYRYTNNYMEFSLRKVFKWNQPGQKYHTLRTVFYRDIDGNRLKGNNEPGVENVVMSILNNSTIDTSYHYNGEMFGNMDVASNYNGLTIYKNIPEAQYMLTFNPTDEQNERFNIADDRILIDLKRDTTIYVPFVERNLVFGTIKFNRARRSSIQDLKLDGIKVSITDSHGQSWYAFTDQQGYYEIFAPAADFYTVQIANNIWSEYFDLRQDKYIIKFNGYKRFEVNFEFDEKKREIKFDDVVDINDIVSGENFKFEDVTQIKQTILRGTISDETTLAPIQATVEVIDLLRHDVITKLKSSTTNGSFFTTFITGKNYQLRISAPGYWIHQEQLSNDQLTTFETINRDGLLLKKISIGKAMDLRNLLFEENSPELTPEAKAELENVVILLANNENVKINAIGHCANTESDPAPLSMARARKVVEFLIYRGISANRITMEGHGAANSDKDVAQYRKVEIIVTGNK